MEKYRAQCAEKGLPAEAASRFSRPPPASATPSNASTSPSPKKATCDSSIGTPKKRSDYFAFFIRTISSIAASNLLANPGASMIGEAWSCARKPERKSASASKLPASATALAM